DAVGAPLVLLHLLETDSDRFTERGLRHLPTFAEHTHPRADHCVDSGKVLGVGTNSHGASRDGRGKQKPRTSTQPPRGDRACGAVTMFLIGHTKPKLKALESQNVVGGV